MLGDAARAVRLVRSRAAEWKIDPVRLGILGSSAGGHLCTTLLTHFDAGKPDDADPIERQSSRPDLGIVCYGVITLVNLPIKDRRKTCSVRTLIRPWLNFSPTKSRSPRRRRPALFGARWKTKACRWKILYSSSPRCGGTESPSTSMFTSAGHTASG